MFEIVEQLQRWHEPFALATVVDIWRSAPRRPGAAMALHPSGEVVGSVSVGCIESDLYLRCEEAMRTGHAEVVRYGITDEEGFGIGMTCGGEIEVLVQRIDPAVVDLPQIAQALAGGREGALATYLDGPRAGTVELLGAGPVRLREETASPLRDLERRWHDVREAGSNQVVEHVVDGHRSRVFLNLIVPQPRLLIFGAVDFAAAIADVATLLGYYIVVCDARPAFATTTRFPTADEVVVCWPHELLARSEVDRSTAICVLTHDPKFDEPLLEVAVTTPAQYIGVMGSRQTHEDRLSRLRSRGLDEQELARLSSPMGLDLGGYSPHETAVSIVGEIIATRWGGSGSPLTERSGPIHADSSVHA